MINSTLFRYCCCWRIILFFLFLEIGNLLNICKIIHTHRVVWNHDFYPISMTSIQLKPIRCHSKVCNFFLGCVCVCQVVKWHNNNISMFHFILFILHLSIIALLYRIVISKLRNIFAKKKYECTACGFI